MAGLLMALLLPLNAVSVRAAVVPIDEMETLTQVTLDAFSDVSAEEIEPLPLVALRALTKHRAAKEALTEKKASSENKKTPSENKQIADNTIPWNGRKLTRLLGTVNGPSGKETYYNLNMWKIVNNLKSHGWMWQQIDPSLRQNVAGEYYVRQDGCKMLGPYIMVAAHLGIHPRGSLVQTSLGTGVVVDTGAFSKSNAHQIDIAVNW